MYLRSIKIQLYPTLKQKNVLNRHFGACRFIYNLALEYKIMLYRDHKISISEYDLIRQLTDVKQEPSAFWLYNIKNECLQNSILNIGTAYKNFFKGAGFPKFKSKRSKQSFHQNRSVKILKNTNKIIFYSNKIKFRCSERDKELLNTAKLKSITYSKDKLNHYWASVLIEDEIKPLLPIQTEIGIDLGLKHFAITSNGEFIDNPRFLKKSEKKLTRISRWHSRKKKGSKNKEEARYRLVKTYLKITNQRNNFLHNISKRLINENQVLHLETLDIKEMTKRCEPIQDENGRYLPNGQSEKSGLNKSIQDVSWGKFVGMLEYKALWYGREVHKIDRFVPSSKTCSHCGWIDKDQTMEDRVFICDICGHIEDRDLNAAKNIMKFSKTELDLSNSSRDELTRINACGEQDSSHSMKQEHKSLVLQN